MTKPKKRIKRPIDRAEVFRRQMQERLQYSVECIEFAKIGLLKMRELERLERELRKERLKAVGRKKWVFPLPSHKKNRLKEKNLTEFLIGFVRTDYKTNMALYKEVKEDLSHMLKKESQKKRELREFHKK